MESDPLLLDKTKQAASSGQEGDTSSASSFAWAPIAKFLVHSFVATHRDRSQAARHSVVLADKDANLPPKTELVVSPKITANTHSAEL